MNALLARLLRKRNLTADQLSDEEKVTFQKWEAVLTKKELTIADLRHFIAARIEHIENKWKDYTMTQAAKAELVPYHTVYKTLLQAIDAPLSERAALEQVLMQQLN